MPSIPLMIVRTCYNIGSFKPYYNWNAFNTDRQRELDESVVKVLNLIITGMPSIPLILIRVLILWLVNSLFRG